VSHGGGFEIGAAGRCNGIVRCSGRVGRTIGRTIGRAGRWNRSAVGPAVTATAMLAM